MKFSDNELPQGYHIEIDSTHEQLWSNLLEQFHDATICQTWSYARILYGDKNMSHIVLKKDDDVIAMAQVGIRRAPLLATGISNVHWGPLWKRRGHNLNHDVLSCIIKALKKEYAVRRGHLLRIWPNETVDPENTIKRILEDAKGIHNKAVPQYRTFRLCLTPTLEELRNNLARKWRQALGRAERFPSLNLECGKSDELYKRALRIYEEMHNRKQFYTDVDMKEQGLIQHDLPNHIKMVISICRLDTEPIAALGWSTIGDTGLPLIAATSNKALSLSTNASNLLWWKMLEDMKEKGCLFCDVGGIDDKVNPGGYKFKSGFVGRLGKDEKHVGQFVFYHTWRAHLLRIVIDGVRHLRQVRSKKEF